MTTPDNFTINFGQVELKDYARDFRWTSADAPRIGTVHATLNTTVRDVAMEIMTATRGTGLGSDPAYAAWFKELLVAVKKLRRLPLAYSDWHDPSLGWELTGNLRFAPPPGEPTATPAAVGHRTEN